MSLNVWNRHITTPKTKGSQTCCFIKKLIKHQVLSTLDRWLIDDYWQNYVQIETVLCNTHLRNLDGKRTFPLANAPSVIPGMLFMRRRLYQVILKFFIKPVKQRIVSKSHSLSMDMWQDFNYCKFPIVFQILFQFVACCFQFYYYCNITCIGNHNVPQWILLEHWPFLCKEFNSHGSFS